MLRNTVAVGEELAGNADLATAIRAGLTTMAASSSVASASSTAAAQSMAATTQAPVANADDYELNQDETLSINAALGLLANDAALAGLGLTAVLVSEPAHGTLSLESDGSFTYLPQSGYSGDDSFAYQANAEGSTSLPVQVSLTIHSTAIETSLAQNLADEALAAESDWLA
jgi:hypothetical protein